MLRDPKQFLLLHVEKVVLVVMALLVVLVIYVYQPWSIDVPETDDIRNQLREGERRVKPTRWDPLPPVPDYVGKANTAYRVPWPEAEPPKMLATTKTAGFVDQPKEFTRIKDLAPDLPPVLAPTVV